MKGIGKGVGTRCNYGYGYAVEEVDWELTADAMLETTKAPVLKFSPKLKFNPFNLMSRSWSSNSDESTTKSKPESNSKTESKNHETQSQTSSNRYKRSSFHPRY